MQKAELPLLPKRKDQSHKGDFGYALLIGGSRGMAGAIALAGKACIRSGVGVARVACPEIVISTVAGLEPCYVTVPLPCDRQTGRVSFEKARRELEPLLHASDGAAVGPGLGRSPDEMALALWVYREFPGTLVVDADALYALSQSPSTLVEHAGHRILTPHPGEFALLSGVPAADRELQIAAADRMAADAQVTILLKGFETYITDGDQHAVNDTGNPGMATGGSGDVLTGIITALVCQRFSEVGAAYLGAQVHGLAGDAAAKKLGQISLIATDIIDFLPEAFKHRMLFTT